MKTEPKPKPILFSTTMVKALINGIKTQTRRIMKPTPNEYGLFWDKDGYYLTATGHKAKPLYLKGDLLYVRESFAIAEDRRTIYRADSTFAAPKWKPSIHMPLSAARIFLRITDVRIERIQDISAGDCAKEGIVLFDNSMEVFQKLWMKLNGEHSWKNNPYVWVVEFERTERSK